MALQKLEITNTFNQKITFSVEVNGEIKILQAFLEYNRMAGYWVCSLTDLKTKELLISSLPLLASQDLLEQYGYMKIGVSALINISGGSDDLLDDTNLGSDFVWCWDDNE